MRKKILFICVVVIALSSIFIIKSNLGTKPFTKLTKNEIKEVTVKLLPPNVTKSLNEEEIVKLTEILNDVVIYNKDNSYTEYNGQAVIYTIVKKDGSELEINAYNPFLIIDGVGYKTKYEPCEELNALGNSINRE
ncbi:MAG: hypothetical protein K0S41_2331 [Anaerocolumna sp.]|jgi:hypothetical protein|nr:hypothetical protein [Anaerocolumna sp.]